MASFCHGQENDVNVQPNNEPVAASVKPTSGVVADVEEKRVSFAEQFGNVYHQTPLETRNKYREQFENAYRETQGNNSDNVSLTGFPSQVDHNSLILNGSGQSLDENTDDFDNSFRGNPTNYLAGEIQSLPELTPPVERYRVEEPDVVQAPLIWWPTLVTSPLHPTNGTQSTNPDQLLHQALSNSPRIQAISTEPLISDLQVIEQDAVFDPEFFARHLYDDRVDPVGNTLTTGGADFLEDNIWTGEAGIRKRLRRGGNVDFSQQLGFHNSNSRFFVPQDQGTATLAINYQQPLLRGRGLYVNNAQILIAQSAGGVSWDEFKAQLQVEIENVLASYWQLYFERSNFLQKKRNVERGEKILKTLNARKDFDSLPSQIARARASVQSRKTELANAFRDVRNAETRLRQAIGERDWLRLQNVELLPVQHPIVTDFNVPIDQIIYTALDNRPEIRQAVQRTKIAAIQRDVSENDILPELSFLFGTYVSALRDDSGVFRAFQDQFDGSTPGFSFGLEYDVPIRRRSARSRFSQRKLELAQLQHRLDEQVQNVVAESQIAHRRIQSSLQTLKAAFSSIQAAAADLKQQQARWETFALTEGDAASGRTPTTVLDQLLDAQERLNSTELIYSQALLELQVAGVALNRVTGRLLMHEKVSFQKSSDGWVPNLRLERFTTPSFGPATSPTNVGAGSAGIVTELPLAQPLPNAPAGN